MNKIFYDELDNNLEKTLRSIRTILKKDKNNNIEEIEWIDKEINGYKEEDKIPDYRWVNLRIDFYYSLNGYDQVANTLNLNNMEKICLKEHGENDSKIKDIKESFLRIKNHKSPEPISVIEQFISLEQKLCIFF